MPLINLHVVSASLCLIVSLSHCLTVSLFSLSLCLSLSAGGVSFGQLLGMCDHVTFPLGAAQYRVYKYVPYGPIREVPCALGYIP